MDRKTIYTLVALALVLLLGNQLINHIYPPQPVPVSTNEVAQVTNMGGTNAAEAAPRRYPRPRPWRPPP